MNAETNVIEISPNMRRARRHCSVSLHQSKSIRQTALPEKEILAENSNQEQILRDLLDDSHKRIRLLEAQINRMRSALIETKNLG